MFYYNPAGGRKENVNKKYRILPKYPPLSGGLGKIFSRFSKFISFILLAAETSKNETLLHRAPLPRREED